MNLRDQIAELLDDRNNPDFRRGVLAMKALLPSLDFEKVGRCDYVNDFVPPHTACPKCHGTLQIRSPLEFDDMDWNALLKDLDKSGYILTTKSGERIVRR